MSKYLVFRDKKTCNLIETCALFLQLQIVLSIKTKLPKKVTAVQTSNQCKH
jgi:hypothetical protein